MWYSDSTTVLSDSRTALSDGTFAYATLEQVVSDLVNAGFVIAAQTGQWNSTVITTSPAPGSVVPYGTPVTVYYSLGPQPVPAGGSVPFVVGMLYPAAAAAIAQVPGISVGNPIYQQSALPGGQVLAQSAFGTQPYGTIITLTVATTAVSYVADGSLTIPPSL